MEVSNGKFDEAYVEPFLPCKELHVRGSVNAEGEFSLQPVFEEDISEECGFIQGLMRFQEDGRWRLDRVYLLQALSAYS